MKINKKNILYVLLLALALLSIVSMLLGPVFISPKYLFQSEILWQIRLPRIILSALVGIMLGISGVILQGILRNPLADPYILGVSAGAGVGAAVAMGAGLNFVFLGMSSIPILAFMFALGAVLIVYKLAQVKGETSTETLILAGIAVSAFSSAVLALIIIITGQLQSIYFWLLGSFSMASYTDIFTLLPYLLVGSIFAFFYSKELNALLLGEEMALTLGVDVEKVRLMMVIVASLMTAAAVSVSGLIGFVGLIVPHFVRLFLGPNHKMLVPTSALGGAILMMGADTLGRTLFSPIEVPIGVVMALVGSPFFLYVLRRRYKAKR
ncbi:hypothetical protein A3J90_01570 [candidate division WOR-1 bacterium RIFOXYC2_FULL_37_10]|uniref:Iron ABC transporter n=1 Tax=candidate division WOR-1 bacterium RIFOXYB2_FULL_37_13 TaxID=1802579 RepID=A0A1F4SPJ3_UNCSA|nr:MAG: hypothetical protein A2246_05810 [candidate division WOR-1 bacterium RIFOXYA2_FULL_37_7]OGC22361.1 MAG: hypothetical protein A2310_01680 [candidate division WOR-1 bacterium RIFOXYB2_FULL_37_13]OGC35799.1 MAG: hypothetical protein A3J90_01570 [candidate division WOR-1 bacterium RIFOXYC2_FULL_37_10]